MSQDDRSETLLDVLEELVQSVIEFRDSVTRLLTTLEYLQTAPAVPRNHIVSLLAG
jgi:hypothetical protein